jgi:hypothetical protein
MRLLNLGSDLNLEGRSSQTGFQSTLPNLVTSQNLRTFGNDPTTTTASCLKATRTTACLFTYLRQFLFAGEVLPRIHGTFAACCVFGDNHNLVKIV